MNAEDLEEGSQIISDLNNLQSSLVKIGDAINEMTVASKRRNLND